MTAGQGKPPGAVARLLRDWARWGDRQLLKSIPEYHLFESDEARFKAIRELDQALEASRGFWRAVAVIGITGTILANASLCIWPAVSPWRFQGQGWIAAALIALAVVAAVVWIWRAGVVRRLRGKLIESGVPVCRRCGYLIRGLRHARCPECGWDADEAVRSLVERQ